MAQNQNVGDFMSHNVVSVNPEQTLQDAASLMSQYNIGSLPVVENSQLRGMITDRDITLRSTAQGKDGNTQVSDCMSGQNLCHCHSGMEAHEAANLMSQHKIRRLPVVDHDEVVGMVALGDFATQDIYANEAGDALSGISAPSAPNA